MSKDKKVFAIKNKQTNKSVNISRDALRAIEANQEFAGKAMQASAKKLCDNYYVGQTKDVKVGVKFTETGAVDDMADPQLELQGKLAELDPQAQELVKQAMYQFMLALNGALVKKTEDGTEEFKKIMKA